MRFVGRDQTIVDATSGLMWTRDAGCAPFPLTWYEALDAVTEFNCRTLYGYDDWRLPNRRELFSLVSHDRINPALPAGHPFINVFEGYYWSSTTCNRLPMQAWYVHLGGARVFKGMKHGSYLVWPVRTADQGSRLSGTGQRHCYTADGRPTDCRGTGQDGDTRTGIPWPNPRFEVRQMTVVDHLTGLIWDVVADLAGRPLSWEAALQAVSTANAQQRHGHSDWRLPGVRELESLCDMATHAPALPQAHPFVQVRSFYWSASTSRYDPRYAWALYLEDGAVGVGYKPLAEFFVWAVSKRRLGTNG